MQNSQVGNFFRAVSVNHSCAPIEVREQLAFNRDDTRAFLLRLKESLGVGEAILLSTCNRTEFYWNDSSVDPHLVVRFLAGYKGVKSENVASYFQIFDDPEGAVQHLYRVGIGLESQVLGDLQIISQVKDAYQACVDVEMAGPFLHRLLHGIFFANKRVVQETQFRSGSASVSYATKELVEDLISNRDSSILVIGLGDIGTAAIKNLIEARFTNISVCNRTLSHALDFANEYPVNVIPYEEWERSIPSNEVVISAVSGEILKIDQRHLQPNGTYQYFIDLGLPRSISPSIEELPGILLFNLDQIDQKVSKALGLRMEAIPSVEKILSDVLSDFYEWLNEIQVSPVIHQIKNSLEQIRREEMARFLRKATDEQHKLADELTKSMMQRIMKTHVVQLKAACKRGESEQLVEVLNQLFSMGNEIAG